MPKKICLGSSCNNLVEMNGKYCPSCAKGKAIDKQAHNKKYDRLIRDPLIVKFYHSRAWKKVRQFILVRDNFLCQHCLKAEEPQITSAELVHHITELNCGEKRPVDFRWVPSDPGTYTLTVFADCKKTIIESDETNNKNSINVTVLLKPIPTPTQIGLGDGDGGGMGDGGSHVWRDGEGDGTDESEAVTSGAETFVNETEPAEGAEKKAKGYPMGTKFLSGGGGGGAFNLAMLIAALILAGLLIYGTRKERERYRKARR